MKYDPGELAQELEEQGNTVQPGPGKDGSEGSFLLDHFGGRCAVWIKR